mmetsp:Transcript_8091/g.19229  ORF Transcript_8091/g.19229 Transcript_8091/m.19229 type:complete len:474 (-) Transcript_8091:68-1489(-)|eukprot:CAMPEP_0198316636 /NCGR_PEP_ID=MMETSP1450-20131203/6457_1 /TAXON_ID=753684 ORGANISM="Madagascaria erythrocladiodes, Strain CCMP3234" /NCGR_SAMPLE_ID=MMETSP1450 /ASSEMBLY_ACC=CAM_ASM_001115 /LENGTH=473 /DNA_ID=CAMNT_0044019803 /DNA_START=284 /DNA_END=1705 /DNA_ORIENTATION=-
MLRTQRCACAVALCLLVSLTAAKPKIPETLVPIARQTECAPVCDFTPSCEEFVDCIPGWADGHFAVASNDTISFEEEAKKTLSEDLTTAIADIVELSRTPECDISNSQWKAAVENFFGLRQWGSISSSCLSEHETGDDFSARFEAAKRVQASFVGQLKSYAEKEFESSESYPVGDWQWNFEQEGQICQAEKLSVIFADGSWAVQAATTNGPATENRPNKARLYLNTMIPFEVREDKNLALVEGSFPVRIATVGSGTIVRAAWSGQAGLSSVDNQPPLQNPGISKMLQRNDQDAELASETLLASNILILAVPLVLVLVPSSTLKLTSWKSIFVYILMTDFITTLPFLVRGVELVLQATKRSSIALAWHTGNIGEAEHMDIWFTSCSLEQSPLPGILFLVIGIVVLLAGLVVEVLTHKREEVYKASRNIPVFRCCTAKLANDEVNDDVEVESLTEREPARDTNPKATLRSSGLPF